LWGTVDGVMNTPFTAWRSALSAPLKFSKRCNADRIVRCVRVTLENSTCHLQKSYCEFEKVLIKRQIIGDILNMPLA
jgi:hypothetical protein